MTPPGPYDPPSDDGRSSSRPTELVDRLEAASSPWRGFPVAAQPRPLVLTGVVFGLGAPADDETLRVAQEGLLEVDASVPGEAVDALRSAGLLRAASVDSGVRVTSATRGSMGFSTDRGGRQLPSWFLSISGIDGTSYVMDAESQALAFPFAQPLTVAHAVGGYAGVLGDGLTVRVDSSPPWLTKDTDPTSTDVEVMETDTVVVFARRTEVDAESDDPEPVPALTFRLTAPLGARVLCDADGTPVIVAKRKRSRSGR